MKPKISFFPEKRSNKAKQLITENVPIRVSVRWTTPAGAKKRYMASTTVRVNLADWAVITKNRRKYSQVGINDQRATDKNNQLETIRQRIEDIFTVARVKGQGMTVEDFKNQFLKPKEQAEGHNLISYFDTYIVGLRKEKTEATIRIMNLRGQPISKKLPEHGTVKKFRVLREHLSHFINGKDAKGNWLEGKDKPMDEITAKWLRELKTFFVGIGHTTTTANKNFKALKQVLRQAIADKKEVDTSFDTFKAPRERNPNKIALTWDEVLQIFEAEMSTNNLQQIRDVFIFMCATGLSYGDICMLKREHIKDGNRIEKLREKTGADLVIYFNSLSSAIYERYKDIQLKGGRLLPVYSNQELNRQLREVGRIAGINTPTVKYDYVNDIKVPIGEYPKYELISTKAARKTFVSICSYFGMAEDMIMLYTSHKSADTLRKHYNSIQQDKMQAEMNRVFDITRSKMKAVSNNQ